MDHIYPPHRTIEDELEEPRTHFMRKVLHEIEDDIAETSSSELDYDYTREHVDYLIQRHMVETAIKYKQREAMFCQRQLAKTESEPKRFKISLPVNAERHTAERDNADSNNDEDSPAESDNYEGSFAENDSVENENMESDNAEDSFAENDNVENESMDSDNMESDNVENEPKRFKISLPVNAERHIAGRDNADSNIGEDSSAENNIVENENMERHNAERDNADSDNDEDSSAESDNAEDSFAESDNVENENMEINNAERDNADSDIGEDSSAESDNDEGSFAENDNVENESMESDNAEDSYAESDVDNEYMESDNMESDNVDNENMEIDNAEDSFVERDNVENENMEINNAEDSFAVSETNVSVNDDNYLADAEINDLSDGNDNDPTADCLKRKMYSRQKKQNIKKERQTRSDRLAYISHRIHFSLRELFNARQFIRQAEENIKANGGENLITMERAREAYCNPRRVVSDAIITAGLAVTMGVNTKAAAEFDAEIHPPRYPDDSDFRDS